MSVPNPSLRRTIGWTTAPLIAAAQRLWPRPKGLAPPIARWRFLAQIPRHGQALEIGPYNAPQLNWPGVAFFDVLDRAGLVDRATRHGLDPTRCPTIDFVSADGNLHGIDRIFDVVFSSHCIEHQPDLVRHLRQVENVLAPGGAYFLTIPDKRYCFDHFMPEAVWRDVKAAADEQRSRHADASIMRHWMMTTHNASLRHWFGGHGAVPSGQTLAHREAAGLEACAAARAGIWQDVHAWCFTPLGFRDIIVNARREGMTGLEPETVHPTLFGHGEFFAVLRKP